MQKVVTAEEMRQIDRMTTEKYGIPSIVLMESAAHAVAGVIKENLGGAVEKSRILILCGKGNNGGDGAALARILWTQGANVNVYLFGRVDETKGDARVNFESLKKITESEKQNPSNPNYLHFTENTESYYFDQTKIPDCFVVDALFGTGLTRKIEGHVKDVAADISKWKGKPTFSKIISIDVPSGLNADSGEKIGENIQADLTITFTAPKPANVLPPASSFNGELIVANIGSPQELIDNSPSQLFLAEKEDARRWLEKTKFSSASYKNKRGHALLIAGAKNYLGAAVLAGNAAIVSGVGLATVAAPESAHNAIASRMLPEVMTRSVAETPNGAISEDATVEILDFIEGKIDAVAVGSGLSSSEESTRRFVRDFVEKRKTPVILDADALNSLAPFALQGSPDLPLILTPHEGEFLKLIGTKDKDAVKDRVRTARDFATKHKVILVLKGERSLIAEPGGKVVINPTGNSGLGKAGNGDTLAGIIVGFVAQAVQMKVDVFETVVAAVYIAGLAGDIAAEKLGKRSMLATDVRDSLTEAFALLER